MADPQCAEPVVDEAEACVSESESEMQPIIGWVCCILCGRRPVTREWSRSG